MGRVERGGEGGEGPRGGRRPARGVCGVRACVAACLHHLRGRHDEVLAEPHALPVCVCVGQVEARGRGPTWRVGQLLAPVQLGSLRRVLRPCARGALAAGVARRP